MDLAHVNILKGFILKATFGKELIKNDYRLDEVNDFLKLIIKITGYFTLQFQKRYNIERDKANFD